MGQNNAVQLSSLINSKSRREVMGEVKRIFNFHYPKRRFKIIRDSYLLTKKLFAGKFPGYKACNTEYHNFSHSLDALLAVIRLVDGYNLKNQALPLDIVINLLIATLLHDSGYIQESSDTEGTGAKYTATHVERSVQFVKRNHQVYNININDIPMISNMIRCTGLSVKLETILFSCNEEKYAGCILGTSDLLGQMSDRIYLEKLIFLYNEFREAGIQGFNTEFDLIKNTVEFYEITSMRLKNSYFSVADYAQYHFKERFGVDVNLYMEAINRHINYLNKIIADDTTNFRHKLKRGKWIKARKKSGKKKAPAPIK